VAQLGNFQSSLILAHSTSIAIAEIQLVFVIVAERSETDTTDLLRIDPDQRAWPNVPSPVLEATGCPLLLFLMTGGLCPDSVVVLS
jgi:hypothetical protein